MHCAFTSCDGAGGRKWAGVRRDGCFGRHVHPVQYGRLRTLLRFPRGLRFFPRPQKSLLGAVVILLSGRVTGGSPYLLIFDTIPPGFLEIGEYRRDS